MGLYKPARPYKGVMEFCGRRHDFGDAASRRGDVSGFAFVPQNPHAGLDPLKKLAFQWQQARRCAGLRTSRVSDDQELLASLGLELPRRAYPHQWSQGMQQRLLIAFALLSHPKLLVLDEPTSALDPLIAARTITKVMDHAREKDIAVLIVTHDLALATRFASRVAILSEGQLQEFGSTDELLTEPSSDYGKFVGRQSGLACLHALV